MAALRSPARRSRSSSSTVSMPATDRSARCSAFRSSCFPGSVLALLGSNGAGKTTIARVCSGLVVPTRGHVRFDGEDLTGSTGLRVRAARHRARARRSVGVRVAHACRRTSSSRSGAAAGARSVHAALDEAYGLFPRLGERRKQLAGTLSGGEQRMLALARVLVEKPRLLIADELSLGLAPIVVDEVYRTLETIRDSGHDACSSSSSTCTTRSRHRRRCDRAREGRGRVLGRGRRARRPPSAHPRRRSRGHRLLSRRATRRTARRA